MGSTHQAMQSCTNTYAYYSYNRALVPLTLTVLPACPNARRYVKLQQSRRAPTFATRTSDTASPKGIPSCASGSKPTPGRPFRRDSLVASGTHTHHSSLLTVTSSDILHAPTLQLRVTMQGQNIQATQLTHTPHQCSACPPGDAAVLSNTMWVHNI